MNNPTTAAPPLSDLDMEIALLHQPAIDTARKMIFWAGVMYPIQPILIFAMLARFVGTGIFATSAFAIMFGIGCAIFAAHIALAWWAKRSPLPATTTALVIILGYIGVVVHYDLGGLLVPLIGLVIVGRGVLASYRVHKLRRNAAAEAAAVTG